MRLYWTPARSICEINLLNWAADSGKHRRNRRRQRQRPLRIASICCRLMPSESSTAPAACSNGKPLPAAIQKTLPDRSLSICSWFATHGSPVSQTSHRWCLSARLVAMQYFRTTISDEQREESGHLVQDSILRIEAAEFLPHSGIGFPQNPCTSCPYIGLCLRRPDLAAAALVRRPGADDLGWLDELTYEDSAHAAQAQSQTCPIRSDQD